MDKVEEASKAAMEYHQNHGEPTDRETNLLRGEVRKAFATIASATGQEDTSTMSVVNFSATLGYMVGVELETLQKPEASASQSSGTAALVCEFTRLQFEPSEFKRAATAGDRFAERRLTVDQFGAW